MMRRLFILSLVALLSCGFVWADKEEGRSPNRPFSPEKGAALWGEAHLQQVQMDLQQCIEQALAFNAELRAGDYDIEAAEGKMAEATRIGKPVLDYEYQFGPGPKDVSRAFDSFFSGELTAVNRFKFGVGVPLSTFGKLDLAQDMATVGVEAARKLQRKKATEIVLEVKQLYYGILLARELDRLLETASKQIRKEINRRESEEEGGNPTDLLKLKLLLYDLEKKVQESSRKETLALEALKLKLGLPGGTRFEISGKKLRPTSFQEQRFENYRQEGLSERADLQLLDIALDVRRKLYHLDKRQWTPDLGVGAFFEVGYAPGITGLVATDDFNDPFNFARAGFGMQLKGRFDWFGMKAKIQQSRAEYYKIEIQQKLARDAAELDIKDTYLEVQNAKLAMDRAEEAGRLSRQLLFINQSNYDIGLAEPEDLVDAVKSFLMTRAEYFEAVFHFNVAVAKLHQKIGRLPQLL